MYLDIILGDALRILPAIPDKTIDLCCLDPPYYRNIDEDWDYQWKTEQKYLMWCREWLKECERILKDTGSIYVFGNPNMASKIKVEIMDKLFIFRSWIVWIKRDGFVYTKKRYIPNQEVILYFTKSDDYTFNIDDIRVPYRSKKRMQHAKKKGILKNGKRWFPNPNGKMCSDVWESASERHRVKVNGRVKKLNHPTPKPYPIIERIVKASSKPNDVVIDFFAGTGTTGNACRELNRNCILIEKEKCYFDLIGDSFRDAVPDTKIITNKRNIMDKDYFSKRLRGIP